MDKKRTTEIINEVLVYTKMNIKQLGEAIGSPNSSWLYRIANPNTPHLLTRNMATTIVAAFPEISLSYLLTGEGCLLQKKNAQVVEDKDAAIDKLMNIIIQQSAQISKSQEQIDRLITLLEKRL